MPITPIHAMTRSSSIHITLFYFISFYKRSDTSDLFLSYVISFGYFSISTVTTFYIESITNPSRLYKKYPGYFHKLPDDFSHDFFLLRTQHLAEMTSCRRSLSDTCSNPLHHFLFEYRICFLYCLHRFVFTGGRWVSLQERACRI